ncbi:MAG TPA: OB-fold domain-containing protein [Acidimicrobiales bacterium]|nr:OB-fold domain-containing protein [Acidimicrobiales bacterium]
MTVIPAPAPRLLPALDDANRAFWTGGRDGNLMVGRCPACRRWALPPATSCPECGDALVPEPASGRARVWTWTLNSHQYHPDVPPPTLIAIVVLDEQDDLRLATNLVHVDEAAVREGLPVQVLFEDHGEMFYPVFEPVAGAGAGAGAG